MSTVNEIICVQTIFSIITHISNHGVLGYSIREDCLMRFNSIFIATHLRELAGNSTLQVIILYISCGSIHELANEMKLYR
jgi:hypothetical protein